MFSVTPQMCNSLLIHISMMHMFYAKKTIYSTNTCIQLRDGSTDNLKTELIKMLNCAEHNLLTAAEIRMRVFSLIFLYHLNCYLKHNK